MFAEFLVVGQSELIVLCFEYRDDPRTGALSFSLYIERSFQNTAWHVSGWVIRVTLFRSAAGLSLYLGRGV